MFSRLQVNFFYNKFFITLILFVFLFFYQFTFSYNENVEVFFSLARYTDLCTDSIFKCINENHELKLFFSKLYYFIIFKLTSIFVDWNNKSLFVFVNQLIYSIFSIISLYLFSIDRKFKISEQKSILLFLYIGFFLASPNVFMENEHLALSLSLLSIYFFRLQSISGYLISSIVLSFVSGLKGITIFYSLMTIIFCYYFYDYNKKKINYFIFFSIFFHLVVFCIIFEDLLYAKSLQFIYYNYDYFVIILKKFLPFDDYSKDLIVDIPIISGCFIAYLFIFFRYKKKIVEKKVFIFFLTSFAIAGVVLQKGLTYHYYIYFYYFFLFSLIIIKKNNLKSYYAFLSCACIVIYVIFWSPLILKKNFFEKYKDNVASEKKVFFSISQDLKNEKILLYLADGTPNFYLNQSSFCKDWLPIPLARFGKDTPVSRFNPYIKKDLNNKYFLAILNCVEKYNGNYVLVQKAYIKTDMIKNIINNYRLYKTYNTKYDTFLLLRKKS